MGCPSRASAAETARVLPEGRSRASLLAAKTASIDQTYDRDGRPISISDPYNVDLSSSKLGSFDDQLAALISVLNSSGYYYDPNSAQKVSLSSNGGQNQRLGDALNRGALGVQAETQRQQYALSFQRGITERLTLGGVVTWVNSSVKVKKGISGPNTASDIYRALQGSQIIPNLGEGLEILATADINTLQEILATRGYRPFENSSQSNLGDLKFGGRYLVAQTPSQDWITSSQAMITIPTGALKSPNSLTEVDIGQGAWDASIGQITNYSPVSYGMLSHSVTYTHRLPYSRVYRVPNSTTDFLPDATTEESVQFQLGDEFTTQLGLRVLPWTELQFDLDYQWFWKTQTRVTASSGKNTQSLSEDTGSRLETLKIGASITSIPRFLQGKFPIPGEFSVTYSIPTRGKNAVIAPYGLAELTLFF